MENYCSLSLYEELDIEGYSKVLHNGKVSGASNADIICLSYLSYDMSAGRRLLSQSVW